MIYGDTLLLYELEAIATFNLEEDKIKIIQEEDKFLLTEKFGQHWAVMVDQDTDAQVFSTIFAMQFNIDKQLEATFNPSSFRQMNQRTMSLARGTSTRAQAEWWMVGTPKINASFYNENKSKFKN